MEKKLLLVALLAGSMGSWCLPHEGEDESEYEYYIEALEEELEELENEAEDDWYGAEDELDMFGENEEEPVLSIQVNGAYIAMIKTLLDQLMVELFVYDGDNYVLHNADAHFFYVDKSFFASLWGNKQALALVADFAKTKSSTVDLYLKKHWPICVAAFTPKLAHELTLTNMALAPHGWEIKAQPVQGIFSSEDAARSYLLAHLIHNAINTVLDPEFLHQLGFEKQYHHETFYIPVNSTQSKHQ